MSVRFHAVRDIAGEIEGIAGGKLVRHAIDDESHLTFEDVNDLLLRVPVLGHPTPGRQRGDHLIHRLAVRNRPPCDAGTNLNGRIFSFHLQSLRGRMSRANRRLCQPQNRKQDFGFALWAIARQAAVMQMLHRELPISCLTILAVFSPYITGADEKPMMKAVVAHEYGAPEVLKFEEVPRPEPKENEALVRVIASSVNPADPLTLSGKYAREFGTHLPLIPGYDIAGVVEKTGANVTKLKVGDAVYGYPTFGGGWAEYARSRNGKSPRSPHLSTLWKPLRFRCRLDRVAGFGGRGEAAGGTNHSNSRRFRRRRDLRGADREGTWGTRDRDRLDSKPGLAQATRGRRGSGLYKDQVEDIAKDVDAVLDPVGKETLARSYGVVKKGGGVMSLVARPDSAEIENVGFAARVSPFIRMPKT